MSKDKYNLTILRLNNLIIKDLKYNIPKVNISRILYNSG